jgi:hemerythrin superfamily protein
MQSQNAIELLKNDHRTVEALFEQLEESEDAEKVELAQRICTELSIHAKIEEELFYPAARSALDEEGDELVNEATVEHRSLKELIAQIDGASPADELFEANLKVLKEYVQHHVKEEETELMPQVAQSGVDLDELGERLAARKASLKASAEKADGKPRSARSRRAVHVPKLGGARRGSSTGKREGARKSATTGRSTARAASSRTATARKTKSARKTAAKKTSGKSRARR